jgi:cysteine-rich repeat protein
MKEPGPLAFPAPDKEEWAHFAPGGAIGKPIMRKSYPSYSLLTLAGLFVAGSCSIIAEVDRTKIPQDGGTIPEGGQNTGGSSGTGGSSATGGTAGDSGTGGTSGTSGTSGEGGGGGEPGGMGGTDMGGAGMGGAGDGGTGGVAGPECGDGVIDTGEDCEDGNAPPASNDGCSATCQEEPGWTCMTVVPSVCTAAACGDGIRAGGEACDDGNILACGTCSADCLTGATAKASGSVTVAVSASALTDGTTFTLDDDFNPAVTFEFDSDTSVTPTSTLRAIVFATATSDGALRTAVIDAINNAPALFIAASAGTAALQVNLVHDRITVRGNQPIVVSNADMTKVDMAGGVAGDCPATTSCTNDADCASFDCGGTGECAAL